MTRDRPTTAELTAKLRELNLQRIEREWNKPIPPREWSAAEQRARAYPEMQHRRFDPSRQARRRAIRGG
jgi:hypothetical protein